MCGIVGIVGHEDKAMIESMCSRIHHRGPDERGSAHGANVSLGMQRLSIVDLSGGSQPIENENGSVAVVFNGEIYNHQSLREDLSSRGHRFTTQTDTEVLVHGYEEWGKNVVERLNGMFAFAVWDHDDDQVVLGRDRLGIKPLYYSPVNNGIVFSSELTALLEHPDVAPSISERALQQYWAFRYIPAPQTILEDVWKLEPATVATMSTTDPEVEPERYWSVRDSDSPTGSLRDLLESAVEDRLMADVPLGAFLSGGLDSTSIVALMNEVSSDPIETFSIAFANSDYDESSFSRRVADDIGTNHHELTVDPESMQIFDEVVAHLDEPLADPAAIPTYLLAERAVDDVKVVLTGEGSDELFAGYEYYQRYTNWWDTVGGYPRSLYRIADTLSTLAPSDSQPKRYLQYLASHRDQRSAFEAIKASKQEAFDFDNERVRRAIRPCIDATVEHSGDYPRNLLRFDQKYPLPDNLLTKVDRMTMANSLEARVPFLDHRVVEFANSIDARTHLNGGTKPVLQQAVGDIVPDYVLRREKHGFNMPIKEWFASPLDQIATAFDRDVVTDVPYLDRKKVQSIFESHQLGDTNRSNYLWRIFVYIKWYRHHIDEQEI